MNEQNISQTSSTETDEQIYARNRRRFLYIVKIGLSFALLALLIAAGMWYQQQREYQEQKAKLKAQHEEIQRKHQELERQKQAE